ncbi:hypothetical protein ATJ93_3893 [Halopiger aswanensis]|uniref:Uncharacterized protein n=1 Tax=Halopiger aswanensis TaxID=148449 RepID=A0A3R7KJ11_9EURY|nr:hypothetical protein ATJ93_3893 [Halopiger aswanensis]
MRSSQAEDKNRAAEVVTGFLDRDLVSKEVRVDAVSKLENDDPFRALEIILESRNSVQ